MCLDISDLFKDPVKQTLKKNDIEVRLSYKLLFNSRNVTASSRIKHMGG